MHGDNFNKSPKMGDFGLTQDELAKVAAVADEFFTIQSAKTMNALQWVCLAERIIVGTMWVMHEDCNTSKSDCLYLTNEVFKDVKRCINEFK